MKHFCLITNKYKDPDLRITNEILDYLHAKGANAVSLLSAYRKNDEGDFDPVQIPADTQCIIVLGGDGTLIRTATKVRDKEIPLIGINLGSLGYLCEVKGSEAMQAVDRLLEDRYLLEDRIMLACSLGQDTDLPAMNDVVIHHGGDMQVVKINVYVNGEFLVQYKADGIIVATPTGSTGYSMSAGGPIVNPKGDMILLTPNNAHSLGSKSIVLSGDDVIEIEVDKDYVCRGKIYVSLDGDRKGVLRSGERCIIARAQKRIRICKLNERSFLEILSEKMKYSM